MTAPRFPLHLDLAGRRVLVVGGGPVAVRRVTALLAAGAQVVVVSPVVADTMPADVTVRTRTFEPADVDGAWLVLACTGVVDDTVADICLAKEVWCVRADDADASPAWVPAVARAGGLTVSVSAGGDPRRAVAVRDAVALALDTGELPLRRRRPGPGRVTLVTVGPEPDLMTVRGRRALAAADVVVSDGVLGEGVRAQVIEAGGDPAALLADRALAGDQVVHLSEDGHSHAQLAAVCRARGVAVTIVPGVAPGP